MKIKIEKLEELPDAMHPNNIPVSYSTTRYMPSELFRKPAVNEYFYCGNFRTSTVTEILTENTFRTLNSVYRWEVLEGNEED